MSTTSPDLPSLLALLKSLEAAASSDPAAALTQIDAAFALLPPRLRHSLQKLKKAGAWPDKPLEPAAPASPYYMVEPCAIEVVNMNTAELNAELNAQATQQPPPADQYGNAQITLTVLLTSRRN